MSIIINRARKCVEMLSFSSLLLVFIGLVGCTPKESQAGWSVLDADDAIKVGTDTFELTSNMVEVANIPSDPDSLLLGEADNELGTVHADILSQYTCPEGFVFPDGAVLDSAIVTMYYENWYGNGNSPMSLQIYRLDKSTFDYDSVYYTDINPADYCSMADSVNLTPTPFVFSALSPTDSAYSSAKAGYVSYLRVRLDDKILPYLFNNGNYSSLEQFNQQFKGLYITTSFGSSTILYISTMAVSLYYHFTYQLDGRDTTTTDILDFYANDEVRSVNRIEYTHLPNYKDILFADSTISYVASPAHIYTQLNIPMSDVAESVRGSLLQGKRPYVNNAKLKVYATNYVSKIDVSDNTQWAQPPKYMLLIANNTIEDFFSKRSLPNDTTAILASLATELDSLENVHAYYSYNISKLLTQALRTDITPDSTVYLEMTLLPVAVNAVTSSSYGTTTITSVRPLQTITSTTVNTEKNTTYPLRLSVVATGL